MSDEADIPRDLIERVCAGQPIVYPTSTLPALGCLPEPRALDALFAAKGRTESQLVSLGVADLAQAGTLVHIPEEATAVLDHFPPGALTLVLPAHETLDPRLGGEAVAVRVLAHARAKELLRITGPLTATSANPSGTDPADDCVEAAASLNLPPEAALDGRCVGGAPSTLIAWNVSGYASKEPTWTILREGKVSKEEIEAWSKRRT